ncbi:MAG TPA: hypothetical protein VGY55_11250 [Pirellulales bacterium]|nr:hypothetical protein [Pirellulales bacterium]
MVPAIEIIDVLDRNADLGGKRLDFIDTYFHSEFATVDSPRLTTEPDILLSLMSDARKPPRWRGMYRLHQAICLAGPQRLRPLFREYVAPCFFELFPEGRIAVLGFNPINDCAAALMRTLYAAAQTPLKDLAASGFDGIQTLQEWHTNSIAQLAPVLLEIFFRLFYPYVGGYRGGLVGLDFLFLFEPEEKYCPPLYPRDWLAIASNAAEFGREKTDFFKAVQDFHGPEWQHAAHQRVQHERGHPVSERLALVRWYIDRVNRLLYELTDIANFTSGNDALNAIDPVFAFEHSLTVDRLARKTLLAMSLQEVGTAKQLVFEVADLYDGLSQLFGNHSGGAGYFKQLFNTEQGPSLLADRLRQLPAPFDTELTAWSEQIYRRIEDTIVGSVWFKSKVTPQGVLVRDKQLTQENPVPRPEFVAE